jgi:hypothetical protein
MYFYCFLSWGRLNAGSSLKLFDFTYLKLLFTTIQIIGFSPYHQIVGFPPFGRLGFSIVRLLSA